MVAPRVVLVTGVTGYLGSRLAARLQAAPTVERVLGVDVTQPTPAMRSTLGRTEFIRADVRNPTLLTVLDEAEVDTVVHLSVNADPFTAAGGEARREFTIAGTMQLLAACQRAPSLRRFVLKSTAAVYGSSPQDPALFTEDLHGTLPRTGYAKDAHEVEGYVRGFARRRPDVTVTTLRFTNLVGPGIDTPLAGYFALPVVPTVLGFDPRLQFCAETDALEVLRRATLDAHPGTYNVSGAGVLLLSQAIRRAGRAALPVPPAAATTLGTLLRRLGRVDFSAEQLRFLQYGRGVDITALRNVFGYTPGRSTMAAFDEFVAARIEPVAVAGILDRAERMTRGAAVGFATGYAASAAAGAGAGPRPRPTAVEGRTIDA